MARLAAVKRRPEWFRHFFDAAYVAQLREEKSPADTRAEVDFLLRRLRLPRGARVLDVPCGYGRHAAALARRGFVVVGVDLSPAMIAEGRRRFTGISRLRLRRGDMRRLAFHREFDAVVNLYTSFGYFTPAQNQAVLGRMARALKPGGIYAMAGGAVRQMFEALLFGPRSSRADGRKAVVVSAHAKQADLAFVGELLADGKIRPVIDARYPLEQTVAAFRKFGEGHTAGKIVITLDG